MTPEETVELADALGQDARAIYTYDLGDSWEHRIQVEAIRPREPDATYPRCTGGRRAAPPEDVGGTPGFEHFLEAVADPSHPDHDELVDWHGGSFDPSAFDAASTTRALRVAFGQPL